MLPAVSSFNVILFIKLSSGFVEVKLLSEISLVPICFIVYSAEFVGPSIVFPTGSRVVICAVAVVVGPVGLLKNPTSNLIGVLAGIFTGLNTVYSSEFATICS